MYARIDSCNGQSGHISSKGGLPMGKSENNISQPPEGTPRPSLFSAGTPATDHNILDAMASRESPAPASRPRRRVWLLVPLLAAAGWGIATQLQQAPASRPDVQTAAVTAPPAAPPASVASVTAPPAPATPAASISAAATPANPFNTLETAAVADTASGTPTTAQAPAAFDMQAALDAPSPQTAAGPQTHAKVTAENTKQAASGQPAANKTAKTTAAPPKTKVAKTTAPAVTKTAARPTAPASKKTSGRDPDVELLSAIMKHLGDENGTTAAPARSAQTIAELVKSCKGQDAIEALLCQRRICAGSWGKAQACPPNLAPKQTAKATAAQLGN